MSPGTACGVGKKVWEVRGERNEGERKRREEREGGKREEEKGEGGVQMKGEEVEDGRSKE